MSNKRHHLLLCVAVFLCLFSCRLQENCGKKSSVTESQVPDDALLKSVASDMVHITGGMFLMGSTAAFPAESEKLHEITLDSYMFSKRRVSWELYESVMGTNYSSRSRDGILANGITWEEAVSFCNHLSVLYGLECCYTETASNEVECDFSSDGFRLPTEAEWEYAARSLTEVFSCCDATESGGDWCWDSSERLYYEESDGARNPVGPTGCVSSTTYPHVLRRVDGSKVHVRAFLQSDSTHEYTGIRLCRSEGPRTVSFPGSPGLSSLIHKVPVVFPPEPDTIASDETSVLSSAHIGNDGNVFIMAQFGLDRIPFSSVTGSFSHEAQTAEEKSPYTKVYFFSNALYPMTFYECDMVSDAETERWGILTIHGSRFKLYGIEPELLDSWRELTWGRNRYLFTLYIGRDFSAYIVLDITDSEKVLCWQLQTYIPGYLPFSDTPMVGQWKYGGEKIVFLACTKNSVIPYVLSDDGFVQILHDDGSPLEMRYRYDWRGTYDLEILSRPEGSL